MGGRWVGFLWERLPPPRCGGGGAWKIAPSAKSLCVNLRLLQNYFFLLGGNSNSIISVALEQTEEWNRSQKRKWEALMGSFESASHLPSVGLQPFSSPGDSASIEDGQLQCHQRNADQNCNESRVWWHTPLIRAPGKHRQANFLSLKPTGLPKSTMRCYFTHKDDYNFWEERKTSTEIGTLMHCWWECKWCSCCAKQFGSSSKCHIRNNCMIQQCDY